MQSTHQKAISFSLPFSDDYPFLSFSLPPLLSSSPSFSLPLFLSSSLSSILPFFLPLFLSFFLPFFLPLFLSFFLSPFCLSFSVPLSLNSGQYIYGRTIGDVDVHAEVCVLSLSTRQSQTVALLLLVTHNFQPVIIHIFKKKI